MISGVRNAFSKLNPENVRAEADRVVRIRLHAASDVGYDAMFDYLLPETMSAEKRRLLAAERLLTARDEPAVQCDVDIYQSGFPAPARAFYFHEANPAATVRDVLAAKEDLRLPLARAFPPFRQAVVRDVVHSVAVENAVFSLATSLPNIAPFLGLIWAPAEFASDTAFLTMNQVKMTFQLAGASDRPIGYGEQKTEIAGIVAGAFGWRALARELIGKIPMGGGIIPKAAVAYAATHVVGQSIERYYRLGYQYTRGERKAAYSDAFEKGKAIAGNLLERFRNRNQTHLK